MTQNSSCICSICSACLVVCSILVIVPLICALIATVPFRDLYFTPEWNTYEILSSESTQLIPFDPSDCQYSDSYVLYLEVKASEYTGLILSLHDEDVSYSYVIDSCYVDADGSCRLIIPRLDNVYAFVALESYEFSAQTIYWGCSYFNTPYSLYLFFILFCGCCCLVCCCNTCLCWLKYFHYDSPQHKGTLHEGQLPSTIEDPQRQYHPPEYLRNVPEEAQPLFVATQFETVVKDGVAVHTEVTTVPMLTESGRVEVIENVKVIGTDGTNVVIGETTHGFKLN